jgi:plasmid stability protein
MSSITVRNLEPEVKRRLRIRAARNGRSMEDEVRLILRGAARQPESVPNLAEAIRELFAPFGGVELDIPPRERMRPPPNFR